MSDYTVVNPATGETLETFQPHDSAEVERRIAQALLRLAQQAGRRTARGIEIAFPLSRQDLAEMTGTTLHTVSRILSAWESQGLVEGGRQKLLILDLSGLSALAEGARE